MRKKIFLCKGLLSILVFLVLLSFSVKKVSAAFRFISWGDTKSGTSTLVAESRQVATLNPRPKLTIYNGDLCDSWSTSCIQAWLGYLDGSQANGIKDITFPIRGNHDSGSGTAWSTYFNQAATAQRVGATNYTELTKDMTYSFDVENARFIGIDVLGDASKLTTAQIEWLNARLTDAETDTTKGIAHAFIFFHGPPYCVDGHCSCSTVTGCNMAPAGFFNVLNSHPIVSATFHGHEHVNAYTHIDSTRVPVITSLPYEQFVTGDAGAGVDTCNTNRTSYCMTGAHGFAVVDVNGPTVTLNFWKVGGTSSDRTVTFTKGNVTPPAGRPGDTNGDGKVNLADFVKLATNFGKNMSGATNADFDNNNVVNLADFVILASNWTG